MDKVVKLRSRKSNNVIRSLLIIVIVLVLLVLLFSKGFQIKEIEVTGNERYTEQEVLEILDIQEDSNILNIYLQRSNSADIPYLEKIDLRISGINRLSVHVKEKQITGYFPFMSKYLCIDEDGYIVDYTEKVYNHIPIIEGIIIDSFVIGEKIQADQEIIDACLMFYQSQEKYNVSIDTIDFQSNTDDIIVLMNQIKILFGDLSNFHEKFVAISEILPKITDENGTLDLRHDLEKIVFQKNNAKIAN